MRSRREEDFEELLLPALVERLLLVLEGARERMPGSLVCSV